MATMATTAGILDDLLVSILSLAKEENPPHELATGVLFINCAGDS